MSDAISVETILKEDIPQLDVWVEKQEYEYSRTASEVIDYLNTVIEYETVDDAVGEYSNGTDLVQWGAFLDKCGMEQDSDEARVARNHVTSYFDARSK